MKLIHRDIEKDTSGNVTLMPEDAEDMWHIYNLVAVGDSLRASTIRKVTTQSSTGSVDSQRVRTTLTITIEAIDFDTQGCMLRMKGRNITENQYVKMGAYHTLDLELNRKFTLAKAHWDSIVLDRIDLACDPTHQADLAAVVMQEGLANIFLVTPNMTLTRAKIEVSITRKKRGTSTQREKSLLKFYEAIYQGILRHINFDIVKCILVASPGFLKDEFYKYLFEQAVKFEQKVIFENKGKFVLVHSSSGFKQSLKEILADPNITSKLADTKAASEIKTIDTFYSMLENEPSKAFYGLKHVSKANESQAIETLLISDKLFRSQVINERKQYVDLVDSVRENGGDVRLFSSLHVSGEQLERITGVAAILRFPMPEIEEDDSDDEASS